MSYISTERKGNEVYVWERNESGRELKVYPAPFYFYTKKEGGEYTSIFGDALKKHVFPTSAEMNSAKQISSTQLFDSDVAPELKILSDEYNEVPAPKLNITFYDIEVDYDLERGHVSIENPYGPINSISMYHAWKNEFVILAIPPEDQDWDTHSLIVAVNKDVPLPKGMNIDFRLFDNEKDLLNYFLEEIYDTDLISGWHSSKFDDPYIAKRIEISCGKHAVKGLSFPKAHPPKFREVIDKKFGSTSTVIDFGGRINCDYMDLYKKYDPTEKQSFKLESIAEEELGDKLPKLEYEGSLAKLYRNDFGYFIRYNIRDTEILKAFEEDLGYVELGNQICHLSCCSWKHIFGTTKIAEIVIRNFCLHTHDLILPDNDDTKGGDRAEGAYVLKTIPGLYEWVGSIDITSLYPSAIMSVNASPETLRGQFVETIDAVELIKKRSDTKLTLQLEENGKCLTLPAKQWREELLELNWSISGYGTVFDLNKKGIIPMILEEWFAMRKEYKNKSKDYYKQAEKILEKYK